MYEGRKLRKTPRRNVCPYLVLINKVQSDPPLSPLSPLLLKVRIACLCATCTAPDYTTTLLRLDFCEFLASQPSALNNTPIDNSININRSLKMAPTTTKPKAEKKGAHRLVKTGRDADRFSCFSLWLLCAFNHLI